MRGHLLGGGGGHDKRPELLPRALLLYLVSDRVEDPRVDALAALLGGVAELVALHDAKMFVMVGTS